MKMNCAFIIILMLLKSGFSQVDSKYEVKEILDFLRRGDEKIKSTERKEIVYVIGPTGTGKSTLTHLLAGNPSFLRSIASDEDADDFIIEHVSGGKIGNVTFQSKTIYPDLIIDDNDVPFYDCPGFSDTRNTSIEIATTYFTKKVISYADRLKIVFVVNYHSMLKGTSSRSDFTEFVQHATEFLKNVNQYKIGITLVASKVPVYKGQNVDEKLVNKVRIFLKEYRQFLAAEAERTNLTNSKSGRVISNKLDLIDIFLLEERISLFKRPSAAGLLNQIPEVMKNREELLQMINRKINYVEMSEEDFGYTLSSQSKLTISTLAEEINGKITKLFGQINRTVIEHYSHKYVNFNDIVNLKDEFVSAIKTLSKISDNFTQQTMTSAMTDYLMAVNQLNIANMSRKLVEIENHMKYIEFLETVHDKPIARRTSDWAAALRNCLEYLAKEKNWYSFADKLFLRLSEFDVQSNVQKYNVADVERWGLGDSETGNGIFITDKNFGNFLKKFTAFELVKGTEASTSKIDLLNNILNATVKSQPNYTCHNDKMTVKGNFVKFSDLENYESVCGDSVRLIEVFALSTIFFDWDFKRNVDLVVVAPKWCIVHAHVRITLDGADGEDGVNRSDSLFGNNFLNGKPGMPGQNANHFFGYGEEFVNVENLYVTAVGGNGGRGENGFSGSDGQNTPTPTEGNDGDYLEKYVTHLKHFEQSDIGFLWFNRKYWEHETFQSNVHCPSINGFGGLGGFGGHGGTIELNGISGIKTFIKDGAHGLHGLPGKCGKSYDKVKLFKTKLRSCTFWLFCRNTINWSSHRFSDKTCLKNCRDSTRLDVTRISNAKAAKRLNSAFSIDEYKSFARENLVGIPMNPKLMTNFLRSMEQNSRIRAAYDTTSFIDDFYRIEKQFRAMKNEDNFEYFYQSLLERILEYASNPSNKLQSNERTILTTLYAAGLSKIWKIRSGTEQHLIIDIESYLDVATDRIRLIEKSGKQAALNQYKNDYRRNLETKINDNHDIITTDLVPEIKRLHLQLDAAFENLLEKIVEEKNSIAFDTDQYNKMKRKLEKSIIPRATFKVLETVAVIASLFSGFGTVVGATITSINQIAKAFTYDQTKNQIPSDGISYTTPDQWKDNYYQLENVARLSNGKKSKSLLTFIDEIVKMAIGLSFDDILEPLKAMKNKLSDVKRVDLSSDEIDLLQNDVQNMIRKKAMKVKTRNQTHTLKDIDKIITKMAVLQLDVDVFDKYSTNDQKLYEIASAMRQSQDQLSELNKLERGLQLIVNPMLKHMNSVVKGIPKQFKDQKMTSLEAIKWRIQNILKDIRYQMQRFGAVSSKFNGELLQTFDKLDGAISTLSNIFDRIQIYEDQVELSNFIANIESADYIVARMNSSSQDSDALNRLNVIIESNVLLTIFDNALNGFKQTVFPFADFYLRHFYLPTQLATGTSLKTLVKKATDELLNLKLTLKEYHSSSISKNDNMIHTADFSSDFSSSQPFYVWTGSEHKDVIAKLLSGRNVTIKADITKGSKMNAVKFQYLEIHLKSSNHTNQAKLDKYLENFDVTIAHHGNSYYRCDDKFYMITSPTQRIVYSFEKDSNGLPIKRNNVYHKMRHGDFVLSPYALLTISLTARHSKQIKIFTSDFGQLDLELIGRGQFVDSNIDACSGLEKYYAADEVVNEFQAMDKLTD